jgi:hypothetical protein
MEKYIISYCLYGDKQRYFDALYENTIFIREKYNNLFNVLVVVGSGVPDNWIQSLRNQGAEIVRGDLDILRNIPNSLLRLYPILSSKGLGCFMRDADSYLSDNEMDSMSKFINNNHDYHIIRDHPNHLKPIMAGLFAVKLNGYETIRNIIASNLPNIMKFDRNQYDSDEVILADYVYPMIYKKTLIESNFTIYWNERLLVSDESIPKSNDSFMGQIDPKYNLDNDKDMEAYKLGTRKMYLPYWALKLSRYRFLYRVNWRFNN